MKSNSPEKWEGELGGAGRITAKRGFEKKKETSVETNGMWKWAAATNALV